MMKTVKIISIFIFLTSFSIIGHNGWDKNKINTPREAVYLSQMEKEIIVELNKVRTNPNLYAEEYLEPMKDYFDGRVLKIPGMKPLETVEGVEALEECIDFLKKVPAVGELYPSFGMSKGADDHVRYQGRRGLEGHEGRRGSRVSDRISKYGEWDVLCGENIFYGPEGARLIVASLLIDDDVEDRGHRKSLMTGKFTRVGVGTGEHKVYHHMCVITLAAKYTEKNS